jgi:hypothetical protein
MIGLGNNYRTVDSVLEPRVKLGRLVLVDKELKTGHGGHWLQDLDINWKWNGCERKRYVNAREKQVVRLGVLYRLERKDEACTPYRAGQVSRLQQGSSSTRPREMPRPPFGSACRPFADRFRARGM